MPSAGRLCADKKIRLYAKNKYKNVCIYAKKSVPLYIERWEVVFHLKLKFLNIMKQESLKVTYREWLVIEHSLKCYADKWSVLADDLQEIMDNRATCAGMKERCEQEIQKLNKIRQDVLELCLNLSNQASEVYKIPE